MKKIYILLLTLSMLVSSLLFPYAQQESQPEISGGAGVLIDYSSREVLYNKNAFEKMYPASTTKVMTALLTLENCDNLDEPVHIDYDLSYTGGSSMYIKPGETFTVRQLLEFMLIHSANDAAVALANHVAGSTDGFKTMMNRRAKELGCKNTHFNNPNGMPDENHYTCAYDLALIAAQAMKNETFKTIVKSPSIKAAPTDQTPEWRVYKNSNRFLWGTGSYNKIDYKGQSINIKYDIIDGIKTGYTNAAGNCLISSAQKDGMRLISVILKAEGSNVYLDSRTLIDYGFESYHFEKYISKGKIVGEKRIFLSKEKKLAYTVENDIGFALPDGKTINDLNLSSKTILNDDIKPPIKKGDAIGYIEIYKNGELYSHEKLICTSDINPLSISKAIAAAAIVLLKYLLMAVLSLALLCIVVRTINIKLLRKKKNRSVKNYKYNS